LANDVCVGKRDAYSGGVLNPRNNLLAINNLTLLYLSIFV